MKEVFFNAAACFLYLSASSYMGFAVNFWLYPRFEMQRAYMAYPAMTAVYVSSAFSQCDFFFDRMIHCLRKHSNISSCREFFFFFSPTVSDLLLCFISHYSMLELLLALCTVLIATWPSNIIEDIDRNEQIFT